MVIRPGGAPVPRAAEGAGAIVLPSVRPWVTAVTGFDKGSGKTALLNALLPDARRAGPVAVFGIGLDGSLGARDAGRPAEVRVEPGDLVLTTDRLARASAARLEILEASGARSSLGRLILGRALRGGDVTLVGTDHLAALSETIELVRGERWAASCLVDGAANRLTQVNALGEAGFLFTVCVERANLARVAARLEALAVLLDLPVVPDPPPGTCRLEGPLTEETRASLPGELASLSVADFTKVFLPAATLARLVGRVAVSVRRGVRFLGVVAAFREVSLADLRRVAGERACRDVLPNPYEVVAA